MVFTRVLWSSTVSTVQSVRVKVVPDASLRDTSPMLTRVRTTSRIVAARRLR